MADSVRCSAYKSNACWDFDGWAQLRLALEVQVGARISLEPLVPTGRFERRSFFRSATPLLIAAVVAGLLSMAAEAMRLQVLPDVLGVAGATIAGLLFLSFMVQRLHNRGRSGWWLLLFFGPHLLLIQGLTWMQEQGASDDTMTLAFLAGAISGAPLFVWGLFETFFLPGERGSNRFGPDPLTTPVS